MTLSFDCIHQHPDALEFPVDLATSTGLLLGSVLIVVAIMLGGSLGAYIDIPSVLIVIGGAICSTMTALPLSRFLQTGSVVKKAFLHKSIDPKTLIRKLVELAEVARRDGILALEGMSDQLEEPFLVRGVQMAVDGTDPEIIQKIMETELENLIERHAAGKGILDALGRYAPAFGMIGTLIGLVAMLGNMDDPSGIGSGMAIALLTTLYGAIISNVVLLPAADKLAARSAEEVLIKTIVIQGVMAIQSGDNPRNVESKLMTFLPPGQRTSSEESAAA